MEKLPVKIIIINSFFFTNGNVDLAFRRNLIVCLNTIEELMNVMCIFLSSLKN